MIKRVLNENPSTKGLFLAYTITSDISFLKMQQNKNLRAT